MMQLPTHPIRVLMDYHAFIRQEYGGVSRIFAEIARHMPMDEVELTLFGGIHVNDHFERLQREKTISALGMKIPRSIGKQRVLMPLNRVLIPMVAAARKPELVHFTYFRRTLPRRSGIREVMTVHDMTHELYPECFPENDPTSRWKRRMAAEVDGIICISENTKHDLLRLFDVPEERIQVIPHGNPMERFSTRRCATGHPPFLLFVGRRDLYKNFSLLLEALAGSPFFLSWQLIAFGGGDFSGMERGEIARLGLAGRVFHKSGSDEQLAGLYRTALALVYTSRYEGFGLPPLEAMSQGCPVVVSRSSSIPEVVGDAGLYFDPESAGELRACLESLSDAAVREDLRDRGFRRAKLFSWERCAKATAGFYREVMNLPPHQSASIR